MPRTLTLPPSSSTTFSFRRQAFPITSPISQPPHTSIHPKNDQRLNENILIPIPLPGYIPFLFNLTPR